MPHKDPEARKAYMRQYRAANRDVLVKRINAWKRERYASDPEYRKRVLAASRAHPAHVTAARQRVYYAIKRGEITRPSHCQFCGRESYIEAAHRSYSKRLDIVWLCRTCHRKWDSQEPKMPQPL